MDNDTRHAGDCLSDASLRAYRDGRTMPDSAPAIEDHLRLCAACLARLDALTTTDDPLQFALRGAGTAIDDGLDPLVRQTVERFITDHPAPAPMAWPQPGDVLDEYRLIEPLGEGGMGMVFRAVHRRLEKTVAIKLLNDRTDGQPDAVNRFQREVKALGQFQHPHIVEATDAGIANGRLFLVMEYVDGIDLRRYVHERGPVSVAQACDWIRQASLGLQHAHDSGLIHRDVKPSNLILTNTGKVKLLDLGLARRDQEPPVSGGAPTGGASATESMTGTGDLLGTADYMAPEQWTDSHRVGPASDLYGLGCTLFFLLAGHPPYPNTRFPSTAQKQEAHRNAPIPSIKALRSEVPTRIDRLVQRMMAKRPEDRPASAAEVARLLTRTPNRRRRWLLAPILALAAITVAVVIWPRIKTPNRSTAESPPVVSGPAVDPPVPKIAPPMGTIPMSAVDAQELVRKWAIFTGMKPQQDNTLQMTMVLIPPGEWDASPTHRVRLSRPYLIAAHEVTVKQFREFVNSTSHRTDAETNGRGGFRSTLDGPGGQRKVVIDPRQTWRTPGPVTGDDYPVTQISWHDARAFCNWLSVRESAVYRLPTEAEWTWAMGAGVPLKQVYNADLPAIGWLATNAPDGPQPVGRKVPNPWGLFDTIGNVREWCHDWYLTTRDRKGLIIDPADPLEPIPDPVTKVMTRSRMTLGYGHLEQLPLRTRLLYLPCAPESSFADLGFRPVRELPDPSR